MSKLTLYKNDEPRPEMDEMLSEFFKAEMPKQWPAFQAPKAARGPVAGVPYVGVFGLEDDETVDHLGNRETLELDRQLVGRDSQGGLRAGSVGDKDAVEVLVHESPRLGRRPRGVGGRENVGRRAPHQPMQGRGGGAHQNGISSEYSGSTSS